LTVALAELLRREPAEAHVLLAHWLASGSTRRLWTAAYALMIASRPGKAERDKLLALMDLDAPAFCGALGSALTPGDERPTRTRRRLLHATSCACLRNLSQQRTLLQLSEPIGPPTLTVERFYANDSEASAPRRSSSCSPKHVNTGCSLPQRSVNSWRLSSVMQVPGARANGRSQAIREIMAGSGARTKLGAPLAAQYWTARPDVWLILDACDAQSASNVRKIAFEQLLREHPRKFVAAAIEETQRYTQVKVVVLEALGRLATTKAKPS
jgi:hypothetical protein